MKKLVVNLINIYQFFSPVGICKYQPSCSQYTKRKIGELGIICGGWLGLRRIWSCR